MKSNNTNKTKDRLFNEKLPEYLDDTLSQQERYAFEKQLHDDLFDFEAYEGLEDLKKDVIFDDIQAIHQTINKKNQHKISPSLYKFAAIAASIGLIVTLGIVFLNKPPHTKELAENLKSEEQKAPIIANDSVVLSEETPKSIETVNPISSEIHKEKKVVSSIAGEKMISEEKKENADPLADAAGSYKKEADKLHSREKIKGIIENNNKLSTPTTLIKEDEKPELKIAELEHPQIRGESKGVSTDIPDYYLVKGKIVSSDTKEPVSGASVVSEAPQVSAISDNQGYFELQVPRENDMGMLSINSKGYNQEEINVASDTSITVAIEPEAALSEVIDTRSNSLARKINNTGAASTISYQEAKPVIGFDEYNEYLKENIKTEFLTNNQEKSTVVLKLFIQSDGKIANIEVVETPSELYTAEATRLVKEGPAWLPEIKNGVAQRSEVLLSIRFTK